MCSKVNSEMPYATCFVYLDRAGTLGILGTVRTLRTIRVLLCIPAPVRNIGEVGRRTLTAP